MSEDEITRADLSEEEIILLEKYDRLEHGGKDTPLSIPVSDIAQRLIDFSLLEPEGMLLARPNEASPQQAAGYQKVSSPCKSEICRPQD